MSSSFVKDCSDVSAPGNTSSGKTVIIIVNNETGNVSLDGSELQNLLASHTPSHTASHGADGSQVSVVRMGSGATVSLSETATSTVTATADGAQHVNLTVEGFPSIPVEGQVGGTGNYAELPLDADAFRRLESVLESEEAREILGKPLLDMVANPEQLGPLEDLMDTSLFEGESQSSAQTGYTVLSSGTAIRKNQSAPKRRSQRQMDKAEREEVEKILAENHKKMQEEREQLSGHQIVVPFAEAAAPTLISLQGGCQEGVFLAEDNEVVKGSEEYEVEDSKLKGSDSAPVRGKGRGRGRGKGRGKGDAEKGVPLEVKGRGRGKKMVDGDGEKGTRGDEGGRGKPRGRGRGRPITVVTTTNTVPNITDIVHDIDGQITENAVAGLKKCKVIVRKKKIIDSSLNEGKVVTVVEGQNEAEPVLEETEATAETQEQVVKKVAKKVPATPKVMPQFEPALFSTPDVMQKVGEGSPTQAIMVKGNGKNIKAQKILLVKKQVKKEKMLSQGQPVKEEKPMLPTVLEEQEQQEANASEVNNVEGLKTEQNIKTEATSEETKPSTTVGETGILSSINKVMKKRINLGEGKSKVIQVKSPTEVREVVVLNSARAGMNKETLVKVIPPKDPPKEEEKTPGKQKVPKKEGKQQVKKVSPPIPSSPAPAPKTESTAVGEEEDKPDVAKETVVKEPKKKLIKKVKSTAQKGGDLHKSFEDIVLLRKREEAQRKKEEIQRRREEILRKREAIKKRKEMKEMELKGAMIKKEEITNTPVKEMPAKIIKVTNKVVMVKREVEDGKKNGIQVTAATPGSKQAPSTPQATTIKVIRKVVPRTPTTPQDESPIRRSNRAIKKKTFGDEMLTYDLKEELASEVREEVGDENIEEEVITQEEEEEEEESMEEDGEDDDPERLWCICQKPHNNRFMICCDRCEDWFHGSCVGVTKAIGQQMEHEGKEWVCPKCKKTERAMKGVVVLGKKRLEGQLSSPAIKVEQTQLSPTKTVKRIIINRPDEAENHGEGKKLAEVKKSPDGVKRLGGLSGFTIPKKVNVLHEAITPPKKILSDEKKVTSPQVVKLSQKKVFDGREVQESARGVGSLEKTKPKILVYQKTTGKIISGAEAPTFDELKDWLKEHPDCGILQPGMMNASGTLVSQGATVASSPNSQKKVIQVAKSTVPVSSPMSQKVTVVKSADGRVIVKTSETLEKEALTKVVNTVTSQPTAKTVIVSTTKASVPLVKEVEEKKEVSPTKKEEPSTQVKTPTKESKKLVKLPPSEKKKADNAEVRSNVKKTLAECLSKRYEETKDEFPHVTEEYIKNLVSDIEKELYVHFGKDVGMKYKTRYRSILFNTKDSKNSGLFRKILKGTISPSQLARMTSEELASKELLEWREREEKKELQAIEKHELDMIALGNQYIMKSHKGEIEIDKDEFIKEKEKAPDTLSSLPLDPMAEILDDSTASHNNHIYDLNCKICNGQQEQPSLTLQDSKSHKNKSKEKSSKNSKDHKSDEPAKVKDRKERKSSSDRDKRDRKDSSDKDRHKHRSKDHKEKIRDKDRDKDKDRNRDRDKEKDKDRDRDKEKDKDRDRDKEKDRDRDKEKDKDRDRDKEKDKDRDRDKDREREKDKHRSKNKHSDDSKDKPRDRERHKSSSSISNDKEKERDKERERRDSRDKRDDKDRRRRDKYRDRQDSKDEKSSNKRRDSEKDDKKESRKRRHSGSRSDDRKRRESEKENAQHRDSGSCEKQKDEVSTSEDIVFDISCAERSSSSFLSDGYTRDAEPSSTVIGSPEDTNVMEPASPESEDGMLNLSHNSIPPLPPTSPNSAPPPPADAYSPSSPLNSDKSSPQPPHDRETLTPPPLPDDEMPTAPPLPDYDVPCTPPPPDEYNPQTPPMPGAFSAFKNRHPSSPPVERSTTPPLPEPSSTPPLPRPDSPGTPPLPTSGGTTPTQPVVSSTPPHTPRGSTPPLPKEKSSGPGTLSGVSGYMPSSPTLLDYNKTLGRLTPPIDAETPAMPPKSSAPVLITPEPENVWQGIIHMPDVAKFSASAFEVSGKAKFLPNDVPNMIEVVGRIAPDMVWSYIAQMKKSGSKEILVVRFQPANEEEKVSYIALYSYLSSKKRYAVIGNCGKSVKDFYIVPLASHQTIPQVLLPLNGPGFEEQRAHMLIGVIVRAKSKRVFDHTTGNWKVVSGGQTLPSHKINDSDRSCTPPLPTDEDIQEIALAAKEAEDFDLDNDLLAYRDSRSMKRRAKNAGESSQSKKRRDQSSNSNSPIIGEEPNSPPEDSYVEASLDQESMLAELNRQIEEHKKELSEMQKTIGNDEDEPYSPSHADDSPTNEGEQLKLDTSKISIPSNLQEILDNIREKEAEIKQKEQEIKRRLSLTSDPIVMNYGKYQTYEKKKEKEATTSGKDVDLRPLLQTQTKPNKETKTDTDLRVLKATTEENKLNKVEPVTKQEEDVDLRIRDPRLARAQASAASTAPATAAPPPATESSEKGKTLSKMTDEELLAKALEMEDSESSNRKAVPEGGVESQFHPVIPVPPPFIPPGLPGGFIPSGGPMVGPDPMAGSMPPPPMPPVPPPFLGSLGLPSVDMYGPQSSRLGGPHGHPGYVGPVPGPDAGGHGSSGYSGAPGSTRQRYPNQAWEAGQGYSGRGWGHGYPDRERDRDWNRDWDREWDRDRERDRDREMHPSRDLGHSRYQYKGRRHDRKGGRRREKRDKEKEVTKEIEENEEDAPYPEIDY